MTPEEFQQETAQLQRPLVRLATRLTGSQSDGADVVQDVLLRLWLMRDTLHAPMGPLARVLVHNQAVDVLRRRRPTTDVSELVEACNETDSHEEVERMMKIVGQLPPLQQTLLRLRHQEGMEMGQLAQVLGISEVAVRKALSRARQKVKEQYYKMYRL